MFDANEVLSINEVLGDDTVFGCGVLYAVWCGVWCHCHVGG